MLGRRFSWYFSEHTRQETTGILQDAQINPFGLMLFGDLLTTIGRCNSLGQGMTKLHDSPKGWVSISPTELTCSALHWENFFNFPTFSLIKARAASGVIDNPFDLNSFWVERQ
jgi:hypothetical protein